MLWLAEVFDFSKDEMTSAKIKAMKESLNAEFQSVFNLCDFILTRSQRPQLIKVPTHDPEESLQTAHMLIHLEVHHAPPPFVRKPAL